MKELDLRLQKPTGPSSGVVASILLIIIALSSVSFSFFTHNSHTFQIVLEILVLRTTFKKIRIVVKKIIKNPNLVIKFIIFISLERSCVTLDTECPNFLFFHFIVKLFGFCEIYILSRKKQVFFEKLNQTRSILLQFTQDLHLLTAYHQTKTLISRFFLLMPPLLRNGSFLFLLQSQPF